MQWKVLTTAFAIAVTIGACTSGAGVDSVHSGKSQSAHITLAESNQLTTGMTREQAAQTIGSPGTVESQTAIEGTTTVIIAWDGNTVGGNANATFDDNHLISKAQAGLK